MTSGYDHLKSSVEFPDPQWALNEGLIAVGGTVDVPTLYHAYKKGIFPWPQAGYPMLWFSPENRGIIEFSDFHIPRKLQKELKSGAFNFTTNQAFEEVITECQMQPRKGQTGTWITEELREAYIHFHKAGFAHSLECWQGEDLVGGIYGVFVDGVFSGESMFHHVSNASKLCLVHLVNHLRQLGMTWMDIQMVTPVTEKMGGKYIPRKMFLSKLKENQKIWNSQRFYFGELDLENSKKLCEG